MESFLTEPNGCNVYIFQLNNADSSTEIPVHLLVDNFQLQQNTNQCVDQENNTAESLGHDMLVTTICQDINEEQVFTSNDSESSHMLVKPTNQTTKILSENINCMQNSDYKNGMSENSCEINKHKIQNNVHISDRIVPPKAVAVLPVELQLRRGVISSRRTLPARTRFGPVQGIQTLITPAQATELVKVAAFVQNPIFLSNTSEESVLHIDTSDMDKSNWLSLLRVGDEHSANVWLYEENGDLYGMTVQPIPSRTPLTLGYSLKYAKDHDIPPGQPVINLHEVCKKWCMECRIAEKKSVPREFKNVFKEKTGFEKKCYRCTYCFKTFSRLFTLKRHKRLMCSKKTEKSLKSPEKDMPTSSQSNICNNTSYMDDCRVPSDESLNNFTNILDFPTNLFDTDRINLDISGSSRSENEFNFGNEGVKDPVSVETRNNKNHSKKTTKENEDILTTCPYCTEVLVKDKYRQHFRTCPKRCKCVCGQVFNHKQSLIIHIRLEHPEKLKQATQNTNDKSNKSAANKYKCNECEQSFKRRGMLVNHLWRTHNKAPTSASVPLERRVRHYPCGVTGCPKVYCAKAKRDVHVAKHHPGCEIKAVAIEEAPRVISPAACSACPRQYATRAKLMQHVRNRHPDMYQTMDTAPQPQSTGLT